MVTAGASPGAAYPAKAIVTPSTPIHTQTTSNMNKALTILLGCLALAATAHAQGAAKGKGDNQADTPAELLAKYDKNRDGMLDASELAALTSQDRAALEQHRRHHGHPGRGKGGPGPGGKGGPGGKDDDAGRRKDGPGGKGGPGPGGKGDDAGRRKDGPGGKGDGRGGDAGRGNDNGRGKGKAN